MSVNGESSSTRRSPRKVSNKVISPVTTPIKSAKISIEQTGNEAASIVSVSDVIETTLEVEMESISCVESDTSLAEIRTEIQALASQLYQQPIDTDLASTVDILTQLIGLKQRVVTYLEKNLSNSQSHYYNGNELQVQISEADHAYRKQSEVMLTTEDTQESHDEQLQHIIQCPLLNIQSRLNTAIKSIQSITSASQSSQVSSECHRSLTRLDKAMNSLNRVSPPSNDTITAETLSNVLDVLNEQDLEQTEQLRTYSQESDNDALSVECGSVKSTISYIKDLTTPPRCNVNANSTNHQNSSTNNNVNGFCNSYGKSLSSSLHSDHSQNEQQQQQSDVILTIEAMSAPMTTLYDSDCDSLKSCDLHVNDHTTYTPYSPTASTAVIKKPQFNLQGFEAIQKYLYDTPTLPGVNRVRMKIRRGSNPCYITYDYPLPGWKQVKSVTSSIQSQINYVTPDKKWKLTCKADVLKYKTHYATSSFSVSKFIFEETYCLCHDCYNGVMYECAVGISGCNNWFHPTCVDHDPYLKTDLADLDHIICPLCVCYLRGTGELQQYERQDYALMKFITPREFIMPTTTTNNVSGSSGTCNSSSNNIASTINVDVYGHQLISDINTNMYSHPPPPSVRNVVSSNINTNNNKTLSAAATNSSTTRVETQISHEKQTTLRNTTSRDTEYTHIFHYSFVRDTLLRAIVRLLTQANSQIATTKINKTAMKAYNELCKQDGEVGLFNNPRNMLELLHELPMFSKADSKFKLPQI